ALIHWGDSSTSSGTVSYSGGLYMVDGSHIYAEEGSYSITIDVKDVLDGGTSTTTITGIATVADAALTGSSAATAGGTEGGANSSVLAGAPVTDARPGNHTEDFTATIHWGDTTSSTGTVSYSTGVYTVDGAHTYAEEGPYNITTLSLHVALPITSTTTITGIATVADAALTGSSAATAGGTE